MNDNRDLTGECSAPLVMLDQQLALSAYLQALLMPADMAPADVRAEPAPVATAETVAVTPEVAEREPLASVPQVPPAAPLHDHPYPDWATGDFQCLLFRVAGLTLALPLAKLNGVLPWDDARVTALPGRQTWFLGVRDYQRQQLGLIDVAKVIVPRAASGRDAGFGKVILIGAGRWGLACEAISEVVTLTPTAVKWRGRAGSRPWLAGTVIDRMCALIDADAFAAMLETEGPRAV